MRNSRSSLDWHAALRAHFTPVTLLVCGQALGQAAADGCVIELPVSPQQSVSVTAASCWSLIDVTIVQSVISMALCSCTYREKTADIYWILAGRVRFNYTDVWPWSFTDASWKWITTARGMCWHSHGVLICPCDYIISFLLKALQYSGFIKKGVFSFSTTLSKYFKYTGSVNTNHMQAQRACWRHSPVLELLTLPDDSRGRQNQFDSTQCNF